jgi:hypothetical protein
MTFGSVLSVSTHFHPQYGHVARVWVTDAAHLVHRAFYTKPLSKLPKVGDTCRWPDENSDTAFWTNAARTIVDKALSKFGPAFDPHART